MRWAERLRRGRHRRTVDPLAARGASAPPPALPPASAARGDAGVTLIELLVAVAVIAIVSAALTRVFVATTTNTADTITRFTGSGSALQAAARFADDVAGAAGHADVAAVSRSAPGCGGGTAVVRLVSSDDGQANVTSYHVTTDQRLERRRCQGPTVPAALAATPTRSPAAWQLETGPSPVRVGCKANAGALEAPAPPAGDRQCRIVTMTVDTVEGYTFELVGVRLSSDGGGSVPRVAQCTLIVTDNANVYQDQPDRNFNDRDDYGESPGGRNFIEDRNRSGKVIKGYFRFNLSGPCAGVADGEPAFMPQGRALTGATLRLVYHDATQNTSNQKCSAQHNLDVLARDWDPATLTWNNSPLQLSPADALRDLRHGLATEGSWVDRPVTVDVFPEVQRWYPAAGGGGDWPNYGWVISDLPNGCDDHESHKFMSKGANNALSPRLVLTWTE